MSFPGSHAERSVKPSSFQTTEEDKSRKEERKVIVGPGPGWQVIHAQITWGGRAAHSQLGNLLGLGIGNSTPSPPLWEKRGLQGWKGEAGRPLPNWHVSLHINQWVKVTLGPVLLPDPCGSVLLVSVPLRPFHLTSSPGLGFGEESVAHSLLMTGDGVRRRMKEREKEIWKLSTRSSPVG